MELIAAVRADDEATVHELLKNTDLDINAVGTVEGTKVCGRPKWCAHAEIATHLTLLAGHSV